MKALLVNNSDLTRDKRFSFLTEDVLAGGTTLRLQSVLDFVSLSTSSGQILCIGELGNERTEIIVTSSTTGPSASYKEITLKSALIFDHPQDEKVTIVDWDRVEFSWASTASGSKSTLLAYPIKIAPDKLETRYVDQSQSSGFYFVRFNETVGNTYSDYSVPIPFGGYDDNTVFSIKKRALNLCGEVVDGQIITHEFLNDSLWEARREYHQSPGKRPFRKKYNFIMGIALTGSFRVELPTDLEDPATAQNVYGVRIGTSKNLDYYDKKSWDFDWQGKARSSLAVPYTKGVSTSIWLASGRDFSNSPVISVEGALIQCTRITGSPNSFTITAHGNWSASGGSDAYENVVYGLPDKFTVFQDPAGSAYVYFNRPIDTAYINQNIYLDYYRTLVPYYSDSDVLDEPRYDMYVDFLVYKIKERKSRGNTQVVSKNGRAVVGDANYQKWELKKNQALAQEYLSTDLRMNPDIDHLVIPD